ncbi:hypothetical protein BT96DRAFT_663827 [Gymnopus androsaceus JB14]|uniref:DUF4536 domain-containing protein n=1 Tax=Gymnopus androsaceus JB14 TaxID=1447944 RepID=A0A6A4IHR5_9AGAR|nr:hypothetical protein BT96DRAFT_663827 [Gymnopus androsaceus JB14]
MPLQLDPNAPPYKPGQCETCRYVGVATFGGVGSYMMWEAKLSKGPPVQKRIMTGAGIAFLTLGAVRWFM